MKTLYISDLDGTLLNSAEKLSEYTVNAVNKLISNGLLFSYATARSFITASKIMKDLHIALPVIIYNGASIVQSEPYKIIRKNSFGEAKNKICDALLGADVYPIVYSYIEEKEKFSYIKEKVSVGAAKFLFTRKGDIRENPVRYPNELISGNVFYFTCIDSYEKLEPLHARFKDEHHCVFHKDIYDGEWWLEIMPQCTSKANAVLQLKEYLGAERVIVFGDAVNDIDMFKIADEAYAMENADDRLKAIATAVIGSNDNDGVVKWLWENAK